MKYNKLTCLLLAASSVLSATAKKEENLGNVKASSPSPEWLQKAVIYEANLRQGTKTRDFKGLQRELPRLKDLGVDVIWLMPIHPISVEQRKGTLGSYYAVQDYKGVNPEFGTMEDLKEFVRTAHAHDMKVILDEVCNHTGADHKWVTENPGLYALNEKGEKYGPYDWTDVYKLDYSNPGTRAAMTDALKFWITEADIDGYRCDVAGEVPTDYWEEARPQLEAIKPILMLAESSTPSLLVKAFDVDYAWPMKDVFNAIAATKGVNKWAKEHKENRPEMTAQDIPALIERQKKEFPEGSLHMNMVTNHDLNSWEGTEFDRFGPATGAFAVLSYTLPGVPMMYTGQEVGFNHAFEFFEQDSIQPDYDRNEFTTFYETLNSLKHSNRALDASVPADFYQATNPDILCFVRESASDANNDNKLMVIANLSNETVPLQLKARGLDVQDLTDVFSGTQAQLPAELKPWQYLIFAK
ncbi:MAG: alpha-amylase [Bacteroides sp.]|nr:alpha-amylase [Bacteroides sp.]